MPEERRTFRRSPRRLLRR